MIAKTARLVGGAGTGKTSELLRIMTDAKPMLGGSPFAVGFTSFTRAARAEAVERASAEWKVDATTLSRDGWFRTVHSIAHRQLGIQKGELLDSTKSSAEWIAKALGVNVRTILDDDTGQCSYTGDKVGAAALSAWELSRARMEPLATTVHRMARFDEGVPSFDACKKMIDKYEEAKTREGRFDFSDLLARFSGISFMTDGFEEIQPEGELPPSVKCWVMDEQQDASALIDRCCRRLAGGDKVQWVYIAGDPMQSIFGFGGSDSRHFMSWQVDKERVMPKTWRCPKPVHELGEACLKMMRDGYWDRGIKHADHDGEVVRGGFAESVAAKLSPTEDTLILARCNYLCEEWQALLARRGVPFAKLKAKGATQLLDACNALWSLEHGLGTSAEKFAAAVALLPATGNMRRGAKAEWGREDTWRRWEGVLPDDLEDAGFKPEFAARILKGDWGRLFTGGERWRNAAVKHGPEIATKPTIRVGTVHAAKGMEADNVILSTSVTKRIYETQRADKDSYNEERRVEYVGVTRARRTLVLASDMTAQYRMRIPA